jgi:hypothetical protein
MQVAPPPQARKRQGDQVQPTCSCQLTLPDAWRPLTAGAAPLWLLLVLLLPAAPAASMAAATAPSSPPAPPSPTLPAPGAELHAPPTPLRQVTAGSGAAGACGG